MLRELAQQPGGAYVISAAALGMSGIVAGYIDQVSEEMVAAYTRERENWLLNRSAARGAAGGREPPRRGTRATAAPGWSYVNAPMPVMARPTMSVCMVSVPSKVWIASMSTMCRMTW